MSDFAKRFDAASAALYDILDEVKEVDSDAAEEASEILDSVFDNANVDDPVGEIIAILEDVDKGR